MKDNWLRISDLGFVYEGGFVNDPQDPGGATNLGITIATLSAFRGRQVSIAEVRSLQKPEARQIYRAQYWDVIRGDELPSGVDEAVYDYTINSGPGRAVKSLQKALGVRVDGHMGAGTISALKEADAVDIVQKVCAERLKFMRSLKTFRRFGKGWTARVNSVERIAIGMATGQFVAHFALIGDLATQGAAKADPRDQSVFFKTLTGAGQLVAGTGLTADTALDQLQSVGDKLGAFQEALPIIKYVCIAATIAGVGITVYSLIQKAKEA